MTLTIDTMPDCARLWIYQGDRPFTTKEESEISALTRDFIDQWTAHGQKLKAAYSVEHHQFIVISVNELFNLASGCSIDSSVNLIRKIQEQFNINLLDRTKVAFWIDDQVKLQPLSRLKGAIAAGEIGEHTAVFNNLVQSVGDWKENWLVPARQTWLSRYFS